MKAAARVSGLVFAITLGAVAACVTYSTDTSLDCVVPDGQTCATYPLCGCQAGYNCMLVGTTVSSLSCLNAGTEQANGRCADVRDCAPGFACMYAGANTGVGVCMPYASSAEPASCPDGHVVQNPPVCAAACAPWDPRSCGTAGCTLTNIFGTADPKPTFCAAVGTGVGVGACPGGNSDACAPGYQCGPGGSCYRVCRTEADCASGKVCSAPSKPDGTYDGVAFGHCAL